MAASKQVRKSSLQMSGSGPNSEDWGTMIKDIKNMVMEVVCDLKGVALKTSAIERSVSELMAKTEGMDKTLKRLDENQHDLRRRQKDMQEEMEKERERRQDIQEQLALIELRQKELHLRFRAVPDLKTGESLRDKLVCALSELVGIEDQEMDKSIDSVYRTMIGHGPARKNSGDCLVVFNYKVIKDRVLQAHFQHKLTIDEQTIIILKEIPYNLLIRRKPYKFLTDVLKANRIQFRWLFPEGLSFMYKGRKQKFSDLLKVEEFWRRYRKDLGGEGPSGVRGGEADTAATQ